MSFRIGGILYEIRQRDVIEIVGSFPHTEREYRRVYENHDDGDEQPRSRAFVRMFSKYLWKTYNAPPDFNIRYGRTPDNTEHRDHGDEG